MTYRHERRCRTGTALMAGGMALAASAFGHAQPGYEFDDRLLLGSSLGGGDLSRSSTRTVGSIRVAITSMSTSTSASPAAAK